MISTPCFVCGEDRPAFFLKKVDLQQREWNIVRCQACKFLYVNPRPSEEWLRRFYQDPAYFKGRDDGYQDYLGLKNSLEAQAVDRLAIIESLHPGRRLLDVGCAAGFFLKKAEERGWQIAGVEWAKEMVDHARELLQIEIPPTLEEADHPAEAFDVVTSWDCLEHVWDPRANLQEIRRLLRPGGLLALSTTNAENLRAARTPERWEEFKPPGHLNYFALDSLRALLIDTGFEPLRFRGIAPLFQRLPDPLIDPLLALQRLVGHRRNKLTPFWWINAGLHRTTHTLSRWYYTGLYSEYQWSEGLEAYARKL